MSDYLTLSIDKYVRFMRQQRLSKNTIEIYVSMIRKLSLTDSRLYRLTNYQIQSFILDSNSEAAQNQKINAVKKYFKLIHPDKRINVYTRPKKSHKIQEILTQNEIKKVINSITHLKQKTIISGIYYHGLRISEILNLKYLDIDRNRGLIKIKQSKGKKDRLVPLCKEWIELLEKYAIQQNHRLGYDKPIFYPYCATSIRNVLNNHIEKCEINKKISPHRLRDSYASHLLEQGVDIRFIQEILGHVRVTTTQKYIKISAVNIVNVKLKVA